MKKIIYTIVLLIIIFFTNLLLYFFSESYREMIKDLKSDDRKITDEYILNNDLEAKETKKKKSFSFQEDKEKSWEEDFEDLKRKQEIKDKLKEKVKRKNESLKEDMKWDKIKELWNSLIDTKSFRDDLKEKTISFSKKQKTYIDSIKWFFKWYKLKANKQKDIIFKLTTEFPDERYLEYSSDNLTLYFFINTSYDKIFEIFDVLSYEDSFKINKTNSFWKRSFYLNRFKDDSYVRLVIEYKEFTFWLLIKKKYYNNVKSILHTKLR